MIFRASAMTVCLAMLLAGCSKKDESAVSAVPSDEAAKLNAQHSKFDSASDPTFTAATWFAAGQLAESQNAPAKAIESYEAALKLDPTHAPSLFRLGVVYAQLQKYYEATEVWKRYVAATNESPVGYSNLGFAYELAGRNDEAESAYKKGIARDAKSEPCRVNYGLMLARLGRTNEAIIQLQAVLSPAQVHYNLGSVYEQQGKREQAKAEYRKAVAIDPAGTGAAARLKAIE